MDRHLTGPSRTPSTRPLSFSRRQRRGAAVHVPKVDDSQTGRSQDLGAQEIDGLKFV
jgi:hypothetical protein